jgi:hypothetical protein
VELAALADYLPRYAEIVRLAGLTAPTGNLVVVERHAGLAKNADFGALGEIAGSEDRPLPATGRLRGLIAASLQDPTGRITPPNGWPPRYAARRFGWHVLDHLWEIEDKSEPA